MQDPERKNCIKVTIIQFKRYTQKTTVKCVFKNKFKSSNNAIYACFMLWLYLLCALVEEIKAKTILLFLIASFLAFRLTGF